MQSYIFSIISPVFSHPSEIILMWRFGKFQEYFLIIIIIIIIIIKVENNCFT